MSCSPTQQLLLDQMRAEVVVVGDAILNLLTNNISSYTHDTVQGRQVVTKLNLSVLRDHRDALWQEILILEAQCGLVSDGVVYVGMDG